MPSPLVTDYDYDLGIEPDIIDYIKESMEVQSRISSIPCYLFFQSSSGSMVGSSLSPYTISSYVETTPNYRAVIWSSGSNHPDLRIYTNNDAGAITVKKNGTVMSRILDVNDLISDDEFVVVKREDLPDKRVELVFNQGFDPTGYTMTYYYTTMNPEIDDVTLKRGENLQQSLFGWTQYMNDYTDAYRGKHQILVRFPMARRDLSINEEGKVQLEENQCWMVSEPYVHDFDILVIPAEYSPTGNEVRFEIVDKQDSVIQKQIVSQRFRVKLLEDTDARYNLKVITT